MGGAEGPSQGPVPLPDDHFDNLVMAELRGRTFDEVDHYGLFLAGLLRRMDLRPRMVLQRDLTAFVVNRIIENENEENENEEASSL